MATLPTFPSFTTNDSSQTKLQQLSDAVKFLSVGDGLDTNTRPLWHFYKGATQAIAASTLTRIQYGSVGHDTDGVWTSNGFATVQTQGIYACEATFPIVSTATNQYVHAFFRHTAKANNPNHALNSTVNFGVAGWATGTGNSRDMMVNLRGQTSWVAYPADLIEVMVFINAAMTLDFTNTTCWASFTGYWLQQASTP